MKLIIIMMMFCVSSTQAATHYFVRHAEKDLSNPMNKNPDLSLKGQQRAHNLAVLLSEANIKNIYSTNYNRTEQTAAPLLKKLNITIKHYDPSDMSEFLNLLKTSEENSLVVGHSNTTTEAVSFLTEKAMNGLTEHDFGDVFQVIFTGSNTTVTHLKLAPTDQNNKNSQDIKTK